jgi:hypothetical protein
MLKFSSDDKFIKVKDLKEALKLAPDDAYIVLYNSADECDTFLEQVRIQHAEEGSGYCQSDSVLNIAIMHGRMKLDNTIVVLRGDEHLL